MEAETKKAKRILQKKTPIPELDPRARRSNFDEVALGYTPELARQEAGRCLQCREPKCVMGCPVNVPIPRFIKAIHEGDFTRAIDIIKEVNLLPAVCGRVCPQESQCEKLCTLSKKFEPVGIGRLERFAADREMMDGRAKVPVPEPRSGKRVAIIGSGPSGLTCAYDLARRGHAVTIFEALHEPGGVLVYGIPEFRLPKKIVAREIEILKRMGVEIRTNAVIGKLISIDEIIDEFDACYIGTGAGLPRFMGIEGENLNGVYSSNEFLTRINLMRAYRFPEYDEPVYEVAGKDIAVFGGGNTAMDAVRTALRLGAKNAYLIYRRSEKEMPARAEEVKHAKEEGVQFMTLTNPVAFLEADQAGWLGAARCIRMELGEPDESGRRRPMPIAGSEFV